MVVRFGFVQLDLRCVPHGFSLKYLVSNYSHHCWTCLSHFVGVYHCLAFLALLACLCLSPSCLSPSASLVVSFLLYLLHSLDFLHVCIVVGFACHTSAIRLTPLFILYIVRLSVVCLSYINHSLESSVLCMYSAFPRCSSLC
jgi:hypothetical protein